MILAPTLTPHTPSGGYDADATAFAAISGATDVAALSAFVKGVKEMGLWSNMVCWPLRSSQNAGTGTTAYSLGGLGTFNGTLINGPTWGADGITNSATGRISTTYLEGGGKQCHVFVGNDTNDSALRTYGSTLSDYNTKGIRLRNDAALFGDGSLSQVNRDFSSLGSFKMAAALFNRTDAMLLYLNDSETSSSTGSDVVSGTNELSILAAFDAGSAAQFYSGQAAFYGTFQAAVTAGQYLSFYALYKQTLGAGLGLP